jgi:dTDP-4-amino-4,6-dideoxygalactose transaminase/nucleoside-diphosphate-sugar epimerase
MSTTDNQRPVVVTGVSSFLGAHFVRYLSEKNMRVVGTHSRPIASYSGVEAERFAFATEAGAELEMLDMTDAPACAALIERLKPAWWISHAGWAKNYATEDYDLIRGHVTHLTSYDTIFRALKACGAAGILSTGSSLEYSNETEHCREDDRAWPSLPYGLSKLCKTIRLEQLARQHNFPVRVARVFIPFGVLDMPEKLIASASSALLRGEPIAVSAEDLARDFIWVRDVCRAYLALLHDLSRPSVFDIFNVCGGQPVKLGEILRHLAVELKADPALIQFGRRPPRAGEPIVQYGSVEKIGTLAGWRPESWKDGVAHYAKRMGAEPYWKKPPGIVKFPLVRLSRSSISGDDISRIASIARSAFLGMGSETEKFEGELREYIGGNRHVVCVATGTAALQLSLQACGIGPGDDVLVPSLTFVASFQAVSATGARPVACDVREADGFLDVADAEKRITPRTRAVMPVHFAGSARGLSEVLEFAKAHGLRVIEDAAHAFGGTHVSRKIGSFGDIACFSFDGIKNITAAEGGAVVTDDSAVAERIRDARLLGVEKDTQQRYAGQRSWDFDVTAQGWRYHMSNLNAALGRSQLRRLDSDFAPRRQALAERYRQILSPISSIVMLEFAWDEMVPHIFPVRIAGGRRDAVRAALTAVNIETGIHYKPGHLLSFFGGAKVSLPVSERLYGELLTLPFHFELTDGEQDRVCETVKAALA